MAEVLLEKIVKVYPGGVKAVDHLSLRIMDGEFLALVGPSGCGKSTTLRLVAGLEEPSGGTIRIGDRIVNDVPPKDRDIAMVFQGDALYPHLTAYQNMALGLMLRRMPRTEIDRRVRVAARILGIEGLLERKPRTLSGGQRQRVSVGRAIVRTPKAFLFDEPLSDLDARLRLDMRGELKELHRELQTTTICVTHDQEEAMALGDRVAVMKDGTIRQCGIPQEVYNRPVDRFVAGFIGSPPMNFMAGRIIERDGRPYFDEGTDRLRLPERLRRVGTRYVNRSMIMGVRPTDLFPMRANRFDGVENTLDVVVRVVEVLGDRIDIRVQSGRQDEMVCRVDAGHSLAEGLRLSMYLDMEQVHLFEPGDEGVNVSLTEAGDHASAA